MRALTVPVLVALLATSMTAYGGSTGTRDPIGDENGWWVSPGPECHAAGIDITGVVVTSADGLITAKLHVLDYDDVSLVCEDILGTTTTAVPGLEYDVRLRKPYVCNVACETSEGPYLRFTAYRSGDGQDTHCAILTLADGAWSQCLGTFHTERNVLVWTLPVAGVFEDGGRSVRYDLSRESFEVQARTAYGNAVFTDLLFDYAYPPAFTV